MDGEPQTHMLYDIATIQYLYGANTSFASADDVYGFGAFDDVIKTVWDGGGHDTFDMSGATYSVALDLAEGAFSTVAAAGINNLAIAFGTVIEDAVGSAYDDQIAGNDAANAITGGSGNDQLAGRGGADTYFFATGWGDDTITDFAVDEDTLDFTDAGLVFADLVITSSGSYTLITHLENSVTLQGVATIDENDIVLIA
jgi:serralysin